MENRNLDERWKQKFENQYKNKYRQLKLNFKNENDRGPTKIEKVGMLISIFKETYEASNSPIPEIPKYDLRDLDQRKAYEESNYYVFYFLTHIPLIVKCVHFGPPSTGSPSKRDLELAEELGYKWEKDGYDYYRMVPNRENLDELLQDACFKYGFTYNGILREQKH